MKKKVGGAFLYGGCSLLITLVNKSVLTGHGFPSYQTLALGQMVTSLIVLIAGRRLGAISFPRIGRNTLLQVWPLCVLFFCNTISGLCATKSLTLPMFTALRRFSILMTLIAERIILRVHSSFAINMCVFAMVGGAMIAAIDDLSFDTLGYITVFINNLSTSLGGVISKLKMDTKELGEYGVLFYNCIFSVVPLTAFAWATGDLQRSLDFAGWSDADFLVEFTFSCFVGFLLSYSIVYCTKQNGALTTAAIGCLKNVAVTYLGMFVGKDYIFSLTNFVGLNISIVGSVVYTYVVFMRKSKKNSDEKVENV